MKISTQTPLRRPLSGARTCLSAASLEYPIRTDLLHTTEHRCGQECPRSATQGFTLIETMVVLVLVSLLIAGAMGSLLSLDLCSRRSADYVAAMAVVEAKMEDVRAATYNPPSTNFNSSPVYLTNSDSVALNQAGATFQ